MSRRTVEDVLDAYKVERFDSGGKRFDTVTRVEKVLFRLDKLCRTLDYRKPLKERYLSGEDPVISGFMMDHFFSGCEGMFANENAPGYQAGLEVRKRLEEAGLMK